MNNQNLPAAFMAIGLANMRGPQNQVYRDALDHWDQGCLELVDQLVSYVPYYAALIDAATEHTNGCHYLPAYEIAEPFGSWFGASVFTAGDGQPVRVADEAECKAMLIELVLACFDPEPKKIDQLRFILEGIS